MLSTRIVRNADAGNLQSKTPARSTRRVAFGDISNRKQPRNPTTASAVKKSGAPPTKSVLRTVAFDIPSAAEPKQTLHDTKSFATDKNKKDDDDDDVLGVEISPFSLSEAPVSGVQLNEDDWNEILAEEKEQLEWEHDFAERRRAYEDEEYMKDIQHLERSIVAMHEQDVLEMNMLAMKVMDDSFERSIDLGEEEVISLDIGF